MASQVNTNGQVTVSDSGSGKSVDLPVLGGSAGPQVIDIRGLYKDTGYFTFDPGFTATASCESKITYIDGDEGILLYRGYPIEQLAKESSFLETAYLIIYGELPSQVQLDEWTNNITTHTMLHENIKQLMESFRYDAHPMGMLSATFAAIGTKQPGVILKPLWNILPIREHCSIIFLQKKHGRHLF